MFQLQEKRENSGAQAQQLRDQQQQANDKVKVSARATQYFSLNHEGFRFINFVIKVNVRSLSKW